MCDCISHKNRRQCRKTILKIWIISILHKWLYIIHLFGVGFRLFGTPHPKLTNICSKDIPYSLSRLAWLKSGWYVIYEISCYPIFHLLNSLSTKEIQKPNLPETNPDQSGWHVSFVTFQTTKTFLRFYFVAFF